MNWKRLSIYRIESPEGYIISESRINEHRTAYIARAPRTTPILYCGYDLDEAKTACDQHQQGAAKYDK